MLISLLMMSALAPQSPEPVSTSVRNLPTLGIQVRDERLLDRASGRIVRRTTDAATGAVVDGDALLVEEARARDLASGKISHELAAVLAGEQEKIKVVFWMERDAGHPDLRNVLDAALAAGMTPEDARRAALGVAAEHAARLIAPLVDAATTAGHEVTYIDPYVPIVFVELAPGDVAALAARPDVDQVYYSFPKWESEIEGEPVATVFNQWASPSARTDHVHRKGINGAGVKVMVNDPSNVVSTNPFLPTVVLGNGASAASHATAVAGIISSNHTLQTGAAPGLNQMYSYGASGDQGAPMAWAWGMQQGISFGNCSWWNGNRGSIVFLDRYFDYIIRNFAVMMFKSIGNQGNGRPTTTPGNGYNVTGTGSFYERDTHDWADDTMSTFSSTANPSPGHEKPEVAAPGQSIVSTSASGQPLRLGLQPSSSRSFDASMAYRRSWPGRSSTRSIISSPCPSTRRICCVSSRLLLSLFPPML